MLLATVEGSSSPKSSFFIAEEGVDAFIAAQPLVRGVVEEERGVLGVVEESPGAGGGGDMVEVVGEGVRGV